MTDGFIVTQENTIQAHMGLKLSDNEEVIKKCTFSSSQNDEVKLCFSLGGKDSQGTTIACQ